MKRPFETDLHFVQSQEDLVCCLQHSSLCHIHMPPWRGCHRATLSLTPGGQKVRCIYLGELPLICSGVLSFLKPCMGDHRCGQKSDGCDRVRSWQAKSVRRRHSTSSISILPTYHTPAPSLALGIPQQLVLLRAYEAFFGTQTQL